MTTRVLASVCLLFAFGAVSLGAASREDDPGARPESAHGESFRCSSRTDADLQPAPLPELAPLLIEAAIDLWSGRGTTSARVSEIAIAVAAVVPDALTGVWMLALAQSETDFQDRWVDGSCNRRGAVMCDHGAAFGYWQQHLDEQHRTGDICGAQCLSSVSQCAASALRWLRETPTAWGSWAAQRGRAAEWLRRHGARR